MASSSGSKAEFIVGGKYKLVRKIGSGSFGDIYLAINITNGEVRAARTLSPRRACRRGPSAPRGEPETSGNLPEADLAPGFDLLAPGIAACGALGSPVSAGWESEGA